MPVCDIVEDRIVRCWNPLMRVGQLLDGVHYTILSLQLPPPRTQTPYRVKHLSCPYSMCTIVYTYTFVHMIGMRQAHQCMHAFVPHNVCVRACGRAGGRAGVHACVGGRARVCGWACTRVWVGVHACVGGHARRRVGCTRVWVMRRRPLPLACTAFY